MLVDKGSCGGNVRVELGAGAGTHLRLSPFGLAHHHIRRSRPRAKGRRERKCLTYIHLRHHENTQHGSKIRRQRLRLQPLTHKLHRLELPPAAPGFQGLGLKAYCEVARRGRGHGVPEWWHIVR